MQTKEITTEVAVLMFPQLLPTISIRNINTNCRYQYREFLQISGLALCDKNQCTASCEGMVILMWWLACWDLDLTFN